MTAILSKTKVVLDRDEDTPTHASYVPHITLGYVQEQHAARAIERLDRLILEQQLSCKVLGMNYGDPPN